MLLLVGIKGAAASPYQDISEIPLFIHFFLLLNLFQFSVATAVIVEIKKELPSKIWNSVLTAIFFNILTALGLVTILNKQYPILTTSILILIALFYTIAVFMVITTVYLMARPLLKTRMNLMRRQYILLYILLPISTLYLFTRVISFIDFPCFQHFILLYIYLIFSVFFIFYFLYYFFGLSKSYFKKGFVAKPSFAAGIGAFLSFICSIFLLYISNPYLDYYYLLTWFIPIVFTLLYYFSLGIEYPALLNPKWKTYMPPDLVKVTAAATLVFLALSLFFTVMEHGNFYFISLLENIPLPFFFLLVIPFSAIILILTFTKALSLKTKLKYWNYTRYGLYVHTIATFYVLCLAFLSWGSSNSVEKFIFSVIFAFSFAFYLFYAFDFRKISEGVGIKPVFNKIVIVRYITSLYSLFFLILFSISFTCKKDIQIFGGVNLEAYPFFIFFVLSFLIAFIAYLSVSHKGFEELMRKNIWRGLSYVSSFSIALFVYFIFIFKADMQYFPLRDLFFIAYFAVLIIEIASIKSLIREKEVVKEEIEEVKKKKEDIVDILNSYANKFFRVDSLEDLWEKTLDRYVPKDEITKIAFDPSKRKFHLEKTDEHTKLKIAVGMLLGMHKFPNIERITILKKSVEETKEEIMENLEEKVLMLPEDLRCAFDEDVYYPILYERVVNKLIKHLEAFIPFSDQEKIFHRLRRRDKQFECFSFEAEGEGIRMREGARFSRVEFVNLFRFYLESMEEKFPFRRFLLYELVRDEIKEGLAPYDIPVSELIDIVPTGIEEMDETMAGGLAKGSSTLLITEETKTKHKVLLSFIEQGLREGNNVIYATSKRPAHQIMGELLVDFDELKNFMIIDLYENIYTEERVSDLVEEEHRIIVPLSKILFQRSIVKTIKSQPKEESKIVVIDVYDDFSRYYSPGEILELLNSQIEGLKRWNCTSIISIDPYSYLIKKEGVEEVKKNFDNILILSGEDKAVSVFIEKLYHGTPSKHIIRLH